MTFSWREIVAALLASLAAQGGYLGALAALIAQYLLPLIAVDEKLSLAAGVKAEATGAPDEFKNAVRDYLNKLVDRIKRPLLQVIVRNIVTTLSDTLLDTVWNIVTGKATATANDAKTAGDGGLAAESLAEAHAEIKKAGVKIDKSKS
jgi:hypothetical protein